MMKMNKIEIINEILNIYEENNNLKNEVEFLKEKNKPKKIGNTKQNIDSLEQRIYKIGINTLFENGFCSSYMSKSWNSDKYPDLEEWSNNSINLKDYEEISIKEFKGLF